MARMEVFGCMPIFSQTQLRANGKLYETRGFHIGQRTMDTTVEAIISLGSQVQSIYFRPEHSGRGGMIPLISIRDHAYFAFPSGAFKIGMLTRLHILKASKWKFHSRTTKTTRPGV